MKDELLVHTDYTNTQSIFSIERATVNDTGYYTCRASNDNSAVISTTAIVHIRGITFLEKKCFKYITFTR